MNPIDLPFDEKVKLLYATNSIPNWDNVNFIRFLEVDPYNVKQRTQGKITLNDCREDGLNLETTGKFSEWIKSGKYCYTFQQPVVCLKEGVKLTDVINEKDLELLCGEHRLQAHKDAKRKILVALVKFDCLEDRMIFQSNENHSEDVYIKNPRTVGDVLLTLKNLVDVGIVDINDDKSINSRLTRLNQKTTDFPILREELRKRFNIMSAVKSYTDVERSEWCQEHAPEIYFSSRSKITAVEGVSYMTKTFKGGSGRGGLRDLDYDPRAFFDICSILQSGKVDKVAIIASFNKCNAQEIVKIREYKRHKLVQEWLDRCCSIVDDYRAGKINPVKDSEFLFIPQINNIDSVEEFS
jgi:hypothetical protein